MAILYIENKQTTEMKRRYYWLSLFIAIICFSCLTSCNEKSKLRSDIEQEEQKFLENKKELDQLLILLGTYYYLNPRDTRAGLKYADYLALAGYARLSSIILDDLNIQGKPELGDRAFRFAVSAKNFEIAGSKSDIRPDFVEIVEELNRINLEIAVSRNNPGLYLERGKIFYRLDEMDAASWDIDQALTYDPNLSSGWLYKSLFLLKTGDNKGALYALNKIEGKPLSTGVEGREVPPRLKAVIERLIVIDSLLVTNPSNSNVRLEKASLYSQVNEHDLAIKELNGVIELDARNANAFALRAYVFFILGDYLKALEDVNKAEFLSGREGSPLKAKILEATREQ